MSNTIRIGSESSSNKECVLGATTSGLFVEYRTHGKAWVQQLSQVRYVEVFSTMKSLRRGEAVVEVETNIGVLSLVNISTSNLEEVVCWLEDNLDDSEYTIGTQVTRLLGRQGWTKQNLLRCRALIA